MAQTVATLTDVLKESWTQNRLEKQFYDDNPFLDRIERFQATMIGEQALTPIHKGRSGGYTSTGAAGGSLNPHDAQKVDQALWTLVYHWFQIGIETGALNQTGRDTQALVSAKDLEIEGAINDMRKQAMRQAVGDATGFIAQCASTTTSATVALNTAGYGYDAIVRGWLTPGQPVDIGTTADSDAVITGSPIVSVSESATAPTVTISSSVSTTTSHYVSIANPNSTTVPNPELNGLRNIVAATGSLGGLNPANAGEEFWRAASVDTTTTAFALDTALALQQAVFQKSGKYNTYILTSPKQLTNFYSLLQNQVRWNGEAKMGAGGVQGLTWNGMNVNAFPDIPDREWYMLTLEDFLLVTGNITKPTWASDIEGAGGRLRWQQGATGFVDGITWPFQIGVKRRNTHAAATALTA